MIHSRTDSSETGKSRTGTFWAPLVCSNSLHKAKIRLVLGSFHTPWRWQNIVADQCRIEQRRKAWVCELKPVLWVMVDESNRLEILQGVRVRSGAGTSQLSALANQNWRLLLYSVFPYWCLGFLGVEKWKNWFCLPQARSTADTSLGIGGVYCTLSPIDAGILAGLILWGTHSCWESISARTTPFSEDSISQSPSPSFDS